MNHFNRFSSHRMRSSLLAMVAVPVGHVLTALMHQRINLKIVTNKSSLIYVEKKKNWKIEKERRRRKKYAKLNPWNDQTSKRDLTDSNVPCSIWLMLSSLIHHSNHYSIFIHPFVMYKYLCCYLLTIFIIYYAMIQTSLTICSSNSLNKWIFASFCNAPERGPVAFFSFDDLNVFNLWPNNFGARETTNWI